jgi:hypothetical protein
LFDSTIFEDYCVQMFAVVVTAKTPYRH